jgi:hypothetical protein
MLTNKGLVEHCKKALEEKWGYVWGTFGLILTKALLQQKLQQYPEEVGQYESFIRANWLNRKTVDCVGLIKGYYWSKDGKIVYVPKTDVSANGMYTIAKEKGPIDTLPELPGICVYKQGHIGVYIGNGQVIEARGTKYGVIQTPLRGTGSTPWTHWLKCPYIEYLPEEKFIDIVNHWAREKILHAVELGLMQGDGDNTFDPDKPVTRAQLATVAVNLYDKLSRR